MKKQPSTENNPGLEDRLYDVKDMPLAEKTHLYMPKAGEETDSLLEEIRQYWNEVKPRNVKDLMLRGGAYYLWKMPQRLHNTLNEILVDVTKLSNAVAPEAAPFVGLVYGISKVIEGLKAKSGKYLATGLIGISEQMKKLGKEEHKPIIDRIENIIETYFRRFNPAYA